MQLSKRLSPATGDYWRFVLALNPGSLWAFAFPVVIPLAIWGLGDLWSDVEERT